MTSSKADGELDELKGNAGAVEDIEHAVKGAAK
jgi:hypothetical protein